MPANLYQFHNQPDQLAGFATATESVPSVAWNYCNKKKELQRLEHLWAQDPYWSLKYAYWILKGPFPPGEPAIAQDPVWAYRYARWVLKGRRFPLGEPVIAQDSHYAYAYACDVIKKPWPEVEPMLSKNPYYWEQYLQQFPNRRSVTMTKEQS